MVKYRKEKDSLGVVKVPADRLWGAQTQRSIEHFSIGTDLMPRELISAFAIIKKAAAFVNEKQGRLKKEKSRLIIRVCNELLRGEHREEFPLHVWMTGSGTQFNMNVNEVIANRASQIMKKPLGSKFPIHPNDDVNMSQSSNDTFPTAMSITAAISVKRDLIPAIASLKKSFEAKARSWEKVVKIGRTHYQDATPMTLGQEMSGYGAMLAENLQDLEEALQRVYQLCLGGTAIGTGVNTVKGFDKLAAEKIQELTRLPFITAVNKFAHQGAHNPIVQLSASLKTLAVSLNKIANDLRFLSCGPRAGIGELILPENEPGSSIMPGKVNPTQCEALSMAAIQVMANDLAVAFGGSSGHLEMNVYKPLMIYNLLHSIRLLKDSALHFEKFCVRGMKANRKQIELFLKRSLMLVTSLTPVIGYDNAAKIAHHAHIHDLTLKESALELGLISDKEFDRIVDPKKMCSPK